MSMRYVYTHTVTEATTGYFACEPEQALSLTEAVEQLAFTPNDDFLHRHALHLLCALPAAQIHAFAQTHTNASVGAALVQECAMLVPAVAELYTPEKAAALVGYSPLPYLRYSLREDAALHRAWSQAFAANIVGHHSLPHPEDEELAPLYDTAELAARPFANADVRSLATIRQQMLAKKAPAWGRPPAQETAQRALETLVDNGIIADVEMRHEASLSPIALLRRWKLDVSVQNGALSYALTGAATTYGRGLSVADARASYAMEMVERASAYASIDATGVTGGTRPMPLFYGTRSALLAQGHRVLDPNTLSIDIVYDDMPLHWLESDEAGTGACVLVPVQSVYLFSNLDEVSLSFAPGSTGLASGNTLAEAKAAALTEIIERDAEGTTPYQRSRCFVLRSNDARIQALLDDYAARGIEVQFMDVTSEFGVPCYQCFVMGQKGEVYRATGANLCGARAAISALTEVPFAYPYGPVSGPALRGLPERVLEELPDYTMESPSRNVQLLEAVFAEHGVRPLYVEITRQDLGFAVVRAIIPHMVLHGEPDMYSRCSERLYANYINMFS